MPVQSPTRQPPGSTTLPALLPLPTTGHRLYFPQALLGMDRDTVAAICGAFGDLGASEKLMFWLCEHGALAGKSVAAALEAGAGLAQVERLAAWARARGASRVVATA